MYTSLAKLFYSDKENYQSIFDSRVKNAHAVALDFFVGENQAFFVTLPDLLYSVANIRRIDKAIYKLSESLPDVAINQFIRRSLVDEIELTNGIEGVYSSRREISDVLADLGKKDSRRRFWGIVNKYTMLIGKEKIPLTSCTDIRKIFDELVSDEVAEEDPGNLPDGKIFRKESTSVSTVTQREIHRGVFPEKEIIMAMDKALAILHDNKIDVFFRIALFHYFYGYIHPFYDGNGRTSRFISSYLLSQELEPIIGYRLSYTINENIKAYYDAFETCNNPTNRGDLTPFLIMFVNVIEKSMISLENALMKRRNEYDIYREYISGLINGDEEKYAAIYDLMIQASLFSDEGIPIKVMLRVLEVSRDTLRKRISKLDSSLVIESKISGEKFYQMNIPRLIAIMQNEYN